MEEVEHFLKDYPIKINEVRMLHRCDLSLSLKGHEWLVRRHMLDGLMTLRRCDALTTTYARWDARRKANAAELEKIMGHPAESGEWAAQPRINQDPGRV